VLELAPAGVEQVDGDGWVEYALYGAPGELPALPPGEAEVGGVRAQVSGSEVPEDWADRWRRFHRPVEVGGRLRVRPPWEPAAARPGLTEIVIDPGRAFGTGAHPTTRLCLELLLGLSPAGSFADIGCGSGVLAIAAARLGFAPVAALDNEPAALEAARGNAEANGVALDRLELLDLRDGPPPAAGAAAANLVRPLLLELARWPWQRPRVLLASGLLAGEEGEVAAAFAPMREVRRVSAEGWSALLLAA
jgi:ribosomal protein L11 methyltransferase